MPGPSQPCLVSGVWSAWELLETLLGHADQVLTVKWSPDGKHIVTGECDHSVRIWECSAEILERGKPSNKRSSMKSRMNTLEKRTWEPSTGTYSSTGDHHVSTVRVVSFHPDGKLVATAAWDGTIRLWDVATGTRLKTLEGHKHLVTSVVWSRSGSLLCSTGDHDHTVRVWSAKTTKCVETFTQHTGGVWTCLFTHDERQVLSSSDDGTIRLWNIGKSKSSSPSGAVSEVLFQGAGPIYSLALSSNSKWVLSGSLDASPPEPEAGTIRPSRKPVRVAGTIRGPWEDSYGYPTLRLHDTSGHVLWMEHHTCTIASLAFSRNSTRALLGSQEGALFLYDLSNVLPPANSSPTDPRSAPAEVPTLRTFEVGDGLAVEHVSFSADERAIITDASYTPLENKLWPGAARSASASDSPVYFLLDGWLWRAVPELRRICWVPPTFRHFRQGSTAWRGNMAIRGHIVAFGTKHGQLVILDVSGC
ncbi:WD40-repeat-containing domain protein [Lenzites betulinus]|nr:WD40-repeat-containing domain protein [Lenzites betulinus]